ncbi:type II toxin-antitoxin system HipA family toxin [Paraburkholderia phosphatilytica]|uniref:type II toxin-antitoxin system HipA family toxin n=1 Tax=Paraburkholderia phosphatilytica TaxID=2282883 RepID=UPI000E4C51D3|nr:type II toxin-antitoxin system HipA family toxin [Paraburkholderia phosphatilytica]
MKRLRVIYEGWGERFDLGVLADDGQQILFEYTHAALDRGLELSPFKLALQADALGDFPAHQHGLPGLVSDSLPDGWGMLLMDRLFRKRGIDQYAVSPLDRLAVVGHRGMGALTYAPESEAPLVLADVDLHTIADEVKEVVSGDGEQLLRELILMGGSPHGARPKVLVNVDPAGNHMWNTNDAPGVPWLVKFPAQAESPEVCAVEKLYSDIARECGIDMPSTRYFDLGSRGSAFGIERFDRHAGMRVPVHTAAGVAHADFRRPTLDYVNLLRIARLVTGDMREVEVLFERCVFNVVFNNRDDHSKNFSFRLEQGGQWRIAPAYDTTFNRGPAGEHQLDICGEARAPARAHLLRLAEMTGIRAPSAAAVIDRLTDAAGQLRAKAADYPISGATLNDMVKAVEANRARMR